MRVLVTGGAGFIGAHLCRRWLEGGAAVTIFDNFSRAGSEENWQRLRAESAPAAALALLRGDVRDAAAVAAAVAGQDAVFHLAAQVAVTTSLAEPRRDFEINAGGTLNVLEAARRASRPPFVLYSSTNKVYGALRGAARAAAVGEDQPLDFHSPYGCSKGAADQYVRDYARIFGVPTAVFRMSCIYGPGQNGNEDQGWVAHFARAVRAGETVTIYGDGEQTRDLLFIEDLVEAMLLAWRRREGCAGAVFNIGGGAANVRSLREVMAALERLAGRRLETRAAAARPGDQRHYCSDIRRFQALTGWQPRVGVAAGLARLDQWFAGQRAAAEGRAA